MPRAVRPLPVTLTDAEGVPIEQGGPDREISGLPFRVTTAFTGASIGDLLLAIRVFNLSTGSAVPEGGTVWLNETAQTTLASAPSAANIEPAGLSGLTAAQIASLTLTAATPGAVLAVTPVLDTGAYAVGDTFFDRTVLTDAVRTTGGWAILNSIALTDAADIGPALDLYVLDADVTLGTFNAAPGISDADAVRLTHIGSIAAADWKDVGGAKVVSKTLGQQVKAAAGTRNLWLAAVTQTAGTWTSSAVQIDVGMLWA